MSRGTFGTVLMLVATVACVTVDSPRAPSQPGGASSGRGAWEYAEESAPPRATEELRGELIDCGRRVPVDAPVVTWLDPGGYSAYSSEARFPREVPPGTAVPTGLRYKPGRTTEAGSVTRRSSLEELGLVVDQFVLHYDVCGLSRTCFKVLHDRRELSVHFLLDIDGTLYQTLDLADTAWHARQANARSVGIEIANIGAYPAGETRPLDEWYARDAAGTRLTIPTRFGDGDVRTPEFEGRPARPDRVAGRINGRQLEMHDLTPEQYDSLEALGAALSKLLPKLQADAPRDAGGRVRNDVLSDAEFDAFGGILAHYHVSENKSDPGPAFDWERYLQRVRARVAGQPTP